MEEAYKRRENVTEHERFYITARYYGIVTGEVEKEIETIKDWKQAYPKDWMPHYDLADAYSNYFGQFDDAAKEIRAAITLNSKNADLYASLAAALMGMGTYQDALKTIDVANSQELDSVDLRIARSDIERLQGNVSPALSTASWPDDEAAREAVMAHEAWLDVLGGRMAAARKKIHVVADSMAARGFKESAGKVESDMAVVEAEYGDSHKAIEDVSSALAFSHKANVLINAALVFSLTGQTSRANVIVENLLREFPKDTFIYEVWGPEAQATREIRNDHTKRAIELLESAKPYEMGQIAEFFPIYWRGVAYEREKDSANAAIEFQKIIDHRGVSPTSELYPLALLGLARAAAAKGDWSQSHDCYERLLNQWKDADPGIPVLREAKSEFARLSSM